MMATPAPTLPDGAAWTYEVKWDGYRAQAVKSGAVVSLASRNLKDITGQFGAIARAAQAIDARAAIVDGEIVVLDHDGRPSFQALHHWATAGLAIVYYAFDLLHLNGRDLTRVPLEERRAELHRVVGGSGLLLSEPLPGTAAQIEAAVRELQLEGVVAKRRGSRYEPGRRSDAWIKVRFMRHQELVIGGFKPNATTIDSLVVGYYDKRRLLSAGKVRAGLTPYVRADISRRLQPLLTPRCPFANLPTERTGHWGEGISSEEMQEIRWVKPTLVAEISFVEWTRDGSLRHARFLALRDDKLARDVRREA